MENPHSGLVVGELVRVRGRVWSVEGIHRHVGCEELRLTQAGFGSARACTLLFPFDRPVRLTRRTRLEVVSRRSMRRCLAGALWSANAWDGFHRLAGVDVDLLPFQLEPALALVTGLTSRLLLADDVGLGKTIQAGLALAELASRGWARRVLILTPAGLRDQWMAELHRRFQMDATLVDAAHLGSAAAGAPRGMNPWALDGLHVASYDFVKRPEVVRSLEALLWDLVIVDEAHAVAGPSDRHRAVHGLCQRSRRVLLLTATPHGGDDADFEALCGIGESPVGRTREPIMLFRRTRDEIGSSRRRRVTVLRVTPSADERRMHALLAQYARAVRREAGPGGDARLAMIVLRKRGLSSAASLARSVERRLHLLATSGRTADARQLDLPLEGDGETQADDEVPDEVLAVPGLPSRAEEDAWLRAIAGAAHAASRDERKLAALGRLLRRTRSPVIVFTEYRDTLDRIAASIAGVTSAAALHGGLTRRERIAALARFDDGRARVLVATDTAGEGLNLQRRCRWVVNFELPWTPARIEQRVGRVDRLGQTAPVHAALFVARHTAEMTVIARLIARGRRVRRSLASPGGLSVLSEGTAASIALGASQEWVAEEPRSTRRSAIAPSFTVAPAWLRPAATAEARLVGLERRLARLGCPGGAAPSIELEMAGRLPVAVLTPKPRRRGDLTTTLAAGVVLLYRGVLLDPEGRAIDIMLVPVHVRMPRFPRPGGRRAVRHLVGHVLDSQRRPLVDLVSSMMRTRLASVASRCTTSIARAIHRERSLTGLASESLARTLMQPDLFHRRVNGHADLERRARGQWLAGSDAPLTSLEARATLQIGPVELALAIVLTGPVGPS